MTIDRFDWHYNSAAEAYRERNNITGEFTEEQSDEVCLFAADHIGLFLRWLIEKGYESGDCDPIGCQRVRNGELTGAEYLLGYFDGVFCDSDVCKEIRPFVMEYYGSDDENRPYQYFRDLVDALGDENIFCIISGDKEYNALKPFIERAYMEILKQEK